MQLVQLSLLTGKAYKMLLSGSNREASPRQNALNHRRSWMTKAMMPLSERDSFSHEGRRRTAQRGRGGPGVKASLTRPFEKQGLRV
jgi:hypothetical protein